MKKNTFVLYAMLVLCMPRVSAQAEQDLEVWYKFDYQRGDNQIKDYSGNDRHLIAKKYYGGAGELSSFQWGADTDHSYIYFTPNRDADLVLALENENWKGILASQPRTLATWVKVDQNVDPNSGQWLYSYGDETVTGGGYRIELKGTSVEFANAANTAANQWCNRSVCWMTSYPQATWHHLAFVYDGTGDRKTGMKLYIDGKEESLNPVNAKADFAINTAGLYSPEIGRYMKGISLADFRFYSRALTANEVSALMTGSKDFTIESLNAIIQKAIIEKQSQITIPPGTYKGKAPFLNIKASDLEIIADGVTMVCETKVRALNFDQCKNVTLRGLTIDYNPLTFTQGEIVEVGSGYVDVKIHAGYPVEAYSRIDILDPKTRNRKRGSKFIWGATAENKGNGIIRVFQSGDMTSVARVGDLATMSTGPEGTYGSPHGIVLSKCQGGMVLENVTVYSAPGFGIFESEGAGGTVLRNCNIVPGPVPEGGTETRMLSCSWDAIQHSLTHKGPIVEGCTVRDAGDDSWSVTWNGSYVIDAFPASNRLTLKDGNDTPITTHVFSAGDTLRTALTSEYVIIDKISGNLILIKSEESFPASWQPGMRIYSPNRRCEHFVLRNNHFRSSGRVLVKASHGIIENNTFEDTHSGVTVNSEDAVTAIEDIVIRNNTISGTGHFMPASYSNQAGAVSIVATAGNTIAPSGLFADITIEGNTFSDISGVNIAATSTNGLTIKDNSFYKTGISTPNNTGSDYSIDQNTVVFLKNDNLVTLDNNPVYGRGVGVLVKKENISGLTELNNGIFDAIVDGIRENEVNAANRKCFYKDNSLFFRWDKEVTDMIQVGIYTTSGVLEMETQLASSCGEIEIPYFPATTGLKIVRIKTTGKELFSGKIWIGK